MDCLSLSRPAFFWLWLGETFAVRHVPFLVLIPSSYLICATLSFRWHGRCFHLFQFSSLWRWSDEPPQPIRRPFQGKCFLEDNCCWRNYLCLTQSQLRFIAFIHEWSRRSDLRNSVEFFASILSSLLACSLVDWQPSKILSFCVLSDFCFQRFKSNKAWSRLWMTVSWNCSFFFLLFFFLFIQWAACQPSVCCRWLKLHPYQHCYSWNRGNYLCLV